MKLIRFELNGGMHAGVLTAEGVAPVVEINARRGTAVPNDLLAIIESGDLEPLRDAGEINSIPLELVRPVLPYDVPPKIWCIGLNYKSHAEDIQAVQPHEARIVYVSAGGRNCAASGKRIERSGCRR
jgi:2-keto-4-pentenoate hydratase/2-oxohepta-3-ene-1,7-dioic acid hydratase in catechol pathway